MKQHSFFSSEKMLHKPNITKVNSNTASYKRINFIDTAKGIGILLVVFGHVNYNRDVLTFIYSFHMPLFFFISGMLFNSKSKSLGNFVKKKAQSLICPYVLFYVLAMLFYLLLDNLRYQNINWDKYASYLLQLFIAQGSRVIANVPLWFLPCLFSVEIIYFFISKLKKPYIIGISIGLSVLGWFLDSKFSPIDTLFLPWSLDSAFFVMGFFSMGNLCSEHLVEYSNTIRSKNHSTLKILLIFILCITFLIPLASFNGKVSLGSKILHNGFLLYLTGLLGTFAVFNLGLIFEKSKFLLYLGKNSLYIMAVHYLLRDAFRFICKYNGLPLYRKTVLVETIPAAIIILFLTLIFVEIYKKLKLFFIGLKNKKCNSVIQIK